MPENHVPPAKLFCARFNPGVVGLVIQYVGLQYLPAQVDQDEILAKVQAIRSCFAAEFGPVHFDEAQSTDRAGYVNLVFAAYWKSAESYASWEETVPQGWYHRGLSVDGPIGAFLLVMKPSVWDFETSFSHKFPEGLSHLCDGWSEPTLEHTYWGSMRDRIPKSQFDAMEAADLPGSDTGSGDHTTGRLVRIHPIDNLVVIRSGQDWSDAGDMEREYYEGDLSKRLSSGMSEISDGLQWGCFFQNLLTIVGDTGPLKKSYSLSMWQSLKHLEDWTTKSHKHMEIFASRIGHEQKVRGQSMIRTYHEVAVLKATDQKFEYFNCHPDTGMLRLTESR